MTRNPLNTALALLLVLPLALVIPASALDGFEAFSNAAEWVEKSNPIGSQPYTDGCNKPPETNPSNYLAGYRDGVSPTASWYTFESNIALNTEQCVGGTGATANVQVTCNRSSFAVNGVCLRVDNNVNVRFVFVAGLSQPTSVSFAIGGGIYNQTNNNGTSANFGFDPANQYMVCNPGTGGTICPTGSTMGPWRVIGDSSAGTGEVKFVTSNGSLRSLLSSSPPGTDGSAIVTVEMNWTAHTYRGKSTTASTPGTFTSWLPFETSDDFTGVDRFYISAPTTGLVDFDSLLITGVGVNETVTNVEDFDQGIQDFAESLGFITPESKLFFALILIGLTEIIMALLVGFFAPGKWQIWAIHSVAVAVGVIVVLIGYMEFWIMVIGTVMSTSVVGGVRETLNTFKGITLGKKKAESKESSTVVPEKKEGERSKPEEREEEEEEEPEEQEEEVEAEPEPEEEAETEELEEPEPEPEPEED